jgi:hypothetical protein
LITVESCHEDAESNARVHDGDLTVRDVELVMNGNEEIEGPLGAILHSRGSGDGRCMLVQTILERKKEIRETSY